MKEQGEAELGGALRQGWNRRTLQPRLLEEIFRNYMAKPDPAVSPGWIKRPPEITFIFFPVIL